MTMRHALLTGAALTLLLPAAALAQQNQQNQPQARAGQQQERPAAEREGLATGAVPPEVQVIQPAPDVEVLQPAPDVLVRQPRPQVDLQQARPDVRIEQARPQVEVQPAQGPVQAEINRARPNVTINQGEAVVTIEQAEPEVVVEGLEGQPDISIERMGRQQAGLADRGIADAQQVIGWEVRDTEGDEVGELTDLLMGRGGAIEAAIIDVGGGFLGTGERLVMVPWSEVQVDGQSESLRLGLTEDMVENMAEFTYDQAGNRTALIGRQGNAEATAERP